jgi:hypothetical protein
MYSRRQASAFEMSVGQTLAQKISGYCAAISGSLSYGAAK